MRGIDAVRFNELFIDTVRVFGVYDAWCHYSYKGMTRWEFRFWLRSCWDEIKAVRV